MAALFFVVPLAVLLFSDHQPAAAQPSSCATTLLNLVPCYAFVSRNNSTAAPTPSCCSQLADVIESRPICLCLMLNGTAASYGYVVDPNRAMQLPGDCRLETPPATRCNDSFAESPLGDQNQPNSPAAGSPTGNGVSNGAYHFESRVVFYLIAMYFLNSMI